MCMTRQPSTSEDDTHDDGNDDDKVTISFCTGLLVFAVAMCDKANSGERSRFVSHNQSDPSVNWPMTHDLRVTIIA